MEHKSLCSILRLDVVTTRIHIFKNSNSLATRSNFQRTMSKDLDIVGSKSPTLFLGSSNCLDVLLLVRPPVYRTTWVLYHTGDMNQYTQTSPSSVITFIVQTVDHRVVPHTVLTSIPQPHEFFCIFERVFLTQKVVFRIYGNIGVEKLQHSFRNANISFLCKPVDYNNQGLSLSVSSNPKSKSD
jgi:hypothetical protein